MQIETRNKALLTVLFLSLLVFASSCGEDHHDTIPVFVATIPAGVPVNDVVAAGDFNAYAVSVVPGALYKISITAVSDDVDLRYFGTDFTFSFPGNCAVDNTALIGFFTPEDCVAVAPGGTLYFGVDGFYISNFAASYTIDVERLPVTHIDQAVPVIHQSTTQLTATVYAVPVTTGAPYTAAITGLDDNANLYPFTDGNFASPAACPDTGFSNMFSEDCTLSPTGDTLYFIVDGIFSSGLTVNFTAVATPAPNVSAPVNQGSSGSPSIISLDTPTVGQVASSPTGTSYYVVNGLTSGQLYTVSVLGMTNDVDMAVYTDASFSTTATCHIDKTRLIGTAPEDCTFTASGSSLYFSVSSINGAASFINLVNEGPP